ncbi:hypothetical protein [uncultured Aquimarina sp.]|uniref:hypothetical protein n=1 Tax=uncultured Aquimarina sp. TaxID=575652 RepID=UPI002633AF13|nr:hypothetical protein [uncultured Aquimarina sp.]
MNTRNEIESFSDVHISNSTETSLRTDLFDTSGNNQVFTLQPWKQTKLKNIILILEKTITQTRRNYFFTVTNKVAYTFVYSKQSYINLKIDLYHSPFFLM